MLLVLLGVNPLPVSMSRGRVGNIIETYTDPFRGREQALWQTVDQIDRQDALGS